MAGASLIIGALLVIAAPLPAQIVRGRIVDQGTGGALPGAHVILVDTAGHEGASVLTTDDGRFAIRAPQAGTYALRVQRIGYSSTRSDAFSLGADETIEQQIAAPTASVRLDAITVNEKARCSAMEGEASDAARVWEEVRKALSATTLTRSQQLVAYTLRRFDRDLDASGRNVKTERTWDNDAFGKSAFSAVQPEFLAEHGYSRQEENLTHYFAPDAGVLLSPGFLQHHCLKLQSGKADSANLVGLAFAPTRQDVTEVEGALWVDRQSAELRSLEFRYTGLPVKARGPAFGGRVDYQRLPTGAWIVRDWVIRMPVITLAAPMTAQGYGLTTPYDDTRPRARLVGVHEEGGSVLESKSIKGVVLYKSPDAPAPAPATPPL